MNLRAISIYIGYMLLLEGLFMVPALLLAAYFHEQSSIIGFFVTIIIALAVGFTLTRLKRSTEHIQAREGFVTVALAWILISLFGMLPFYISGSIPNIIDCWFESVSGFTTTGATILSDVEAMPYSMLYWRSFTHWLGGMGVLVFMLAVTPFSRGSGETFHLMRAESPGPSVGKLTPKLRQTARILYLIYVVLTLTEIILLIAGGMGVFDSVVHALGTAGTGGFSTKNISIAAYDSTYLHMVIAVFMMLFGINFSLFYMLLLRQVKNVLKNEELRLYLGIIAVFTIVIMVNILPQYNGNIGIALRDSYFQVSSIITTTGYATTNFSLWPEVSRYLLVLLMLFGACAGSTGGGLKISRLLILMKGLKNQLTTMLRPRAIKPIRMDGKTVDDDITRGIFLFLAADIIICIISIFIVTFDGKDMVTNMTAVFSCINNIGPGLDLVGPAGNFSFFSPLSKLVLSMDMLFGRLEFFPILLLFAPSTWRRMA